MGVVEGWVVGGSRVLAVELPLKLQTAAVAILRIDAQLMAGMWKTHWPRRVSDNGERRSKAEGCFREGRG